MIRKKHIYTVLLILVLFFIVVYTILLVVKKPIEWTSKNSLRPVSVPYLEDSKSAESLIRSIDYSLKYLNKREPSDTVNFGRDKYTIKNLIDSLIDFKTKLEESGLSETFFQYVENNFKFYKSSARKVLYTGYYEASLKGSLKQSDVYCYPLYKKPDDLYRIDLSKFYFFEKHKGLPRVIRGRLSENNTVIPYYDRDEIDYQNMLAEKNLEILWVDDVIDLFFLQIQGSGVIELDSGEIVRVHYDDKNGHPYRAIGALLIKRNILTYEELSMQKIRDYLREHPEEMEEIFTYNPSYIFFKTVDEGPIGAIEYPLTPFRSIASDKYLFPQGGLCYIVTEIPSFDENNKLERWEEYRGFVLNQDVGGAIRGPGRADLFTGRGEKSELIAGHMKQRGTFYFLIKRDIKSE